jgi:hypothetical protein
MLLGTEITQDSTIRPGVHIKSEAMTPDEKREKQRAYNREYKRRQRTDPAYKAKERERQRQRYATDPAYRERTREYQRQRRDHP